MTTPSGNTSICLALLVTEGTRSLERALESVRPVIDCFVVLDLSAGDVSGRVHEVLGDLPGEVFRLPGPDDPMSRSALVAAAQGAADWLLVLDEDMTLALAGGGLEALDRLDADAARVVLEDGPYRDRVPCLLRGTHDWLSGGSAHDRLLRGQVVAVADLDGVRVVRQSTDGERRTRLSRDLRLLNADLARDPTSARTLFHLAQTLGDLGAHAEAAGYYRRRLRFGGLVEELFHCHYQLGLLMEAVSPEESADELLAAFDTLPARAEPLYHLARQNRLRARHRVALGFARQACALALPDDGLRVEPWIYQCGARFELADAAWRAGDERLAAEIAAELLGADPDHLRLPAEYRSHLELIAPRPAVAS